MSETMQLATRISAAQYTAEYAIIIDNAQGDSYAS